MPGFLGTERYFHEKFSKPINLSRDAKSSSKEQEAGEYKAVLMKFLQFHNSALQKHSEMFFRSSGVRVTTPSGFTISSATSER